MGTYHYGWIEVNVIDRSGEDLWFGVVDIGVLAEQSYRIYGELFGVRAKEGVIPIAANRGLPSDASDNTRQDLVGSDLRGHTWIGWDELRRFSGQALLSEQEDWGWRFVIGAMMALQKEYGTENVRIVVAFDA